MEEGTCVDTHIGILDVIYTRMTDDLNLEIPNDEMTRIVLASFPDSYAMVVKWFSHEE